MVRYILLRWCMCLRSSITLFTLLVLISAAAQGQTALPELASMLQQREQRYLKLETQWDWTRVVPGDPAAARRLESDIQRALQSYPSAELARVEPYIRRKYSEFAYGFRQQARWTLCGLGDKYVFWGDLPVMGNPAERTPYRVAIYPNGLVLEGRIVQPISQWILHEPLLLIVIAGISPLRWLQDVQVNPAGTNQQLLVVQGRIRQEDAPFPAYAAEEPIRVTIDRSKGGAVIHVRYTRSDGINGEIIVHDWKKYQGIWLPASITLKGGARGSSQHLKLVSVADSSLKPPPWLREGAPVTDTRLGQPGEPGVVYRFSEQLPSLQELEAMKARAGGNRSSSSSWSRIVPPLLLITVGILWYWRLKRVERKT